MQATRPSVPRILPLLHAVPPWEGFDATRYPEDLHGWNGTHPIFETLIREIEPRLVVEFGSWKGCSAVTMGAALRALPTPADGPRQLVCIDTWLGALEFWRDHEDPERYRGLKLRYGYPTVYYQFLANIVRAGLDDIVVPFPQTSLIGARFLLERGISADLIYIDASHEQSDVLADLTYAWAVARPGGVLFGDDFTAWPGVQQAVRHFSTGMQLDLEVVDENFWVLRKPEA